MEIKRIIKKISIIIILMLMATIMITQVQAHEIEYRGKETGIVVTSENFLKDFGNLMPGDVINDYATIKNSTDTPIEIFFKVEPIDATEEGAAQKNKLLDIINLKIELEHNGKTKEIYNGKMKAEGLKENTSLGKYKKGYEGKLKFTIEIPLELTNEEGAGGFIETKWTFSVEEVSDYIEEDEENSKDESSSEIDTGKKSSPQTGDNIVLYVIILTITVIIFMPISKKRNQNGNRSRNKKI